MSTPVNHLDPASKLSMDLAAAWLRMRRWENIHASAETASKLRWAAPNMVKARRPYQRLVNLAQQEGFTV